MGQEEAVFSESNSPIYSHRTTRMENPKQSDDSDVSERGSMEAKLRVLVGQAKGREIPLPRSQFIIGRDSVCHLRPHSPLVSKFHCAIGRNAAGEVVVRDLKSSNKTYLNGHPIKGTVRVKDGDELRIGPLRFQFVIEAEPEDALPEPLRKEHFHWLMEEAPDSFDLDSDTTIVGLPTVECEGAEQGSKVDEVAADGSQQDAIANQDLSAGQYLRELMSRQQHES